MTEIITSFLLIGGAGFMLLAAIGLLRMPDLFSRMQAATKTSTLGAGSMFLGVAVFYGDLGIVSRSLLVIAFLFLTLPVSAHMIARAAYFVGVPLWEGTVVDELHGAYNPITHELDSKSFKTEEDQKKIVHSLPAESEER
ncbi:MAG: monovalent cation/H(+) antiporter subunit G [Chloroflexia bacterium]|jgi:multicomponent Na+:H+ antiporter subunit G|nr:monovalent cation/H(+) antiporter subunit G [Chloroflexia bacterium]